jgi:hypothetical protein
MSLANEWADGEDSITNPRSHHRSPDRDADPKDQLHSGSRRVRQKGCRSRYGDSDTTDMVAAGYVNNDHNDNHNGPRQGNTYYGSNSRDADRDSRPKTEWRRRRDQPPISAEEMLNGGCTRHTYIDKNGRRKPHISLSSAGNSFSSAKHFRRGCDLSSRSQVLWLTTHHYHHPIRHQTSCYMSIKPPRSITS